MTHHPYAGTWISYDGKVRHELRPNGHYDEIRRGRGGSYQGRYTVTGDHIDYLDDMGFVADGEFVGGVLYHAGTVLLRMS